MMDNLQPLLVHGFMVPEGRPWIHLVFESTPSRRHSVLIYHSCYNIGAQKTNTMIMFFWWGRPAIPHSPIYVEQGVDTPEVSSAPGIPLVWPCEDNLC